MKAQGQELPTRSTRSRHIDDELKRLRAHEESMLDDALAATFPCSDPVSSLCADEAIDDLAPSSQAKKS